MQRYELQDEDNKIYNQIKIAIFELLIIAMNYFNIAFKNIDKAAFKKCLLFFFLLSFIIFGKSIFNEYAMDDEFVVKDNALVHKGIKGIPQIFKSTYVIDKMKYSYEYRPLVKATFAIEYQFFKENPHVSHFVNILLYLFSVILLFIVLLHLFENYHYLFSFTICILFLVHPLHSEVVMSLKNRDVILSFIGCFSSLYFYLKYAKDFKFINIIWGSFFMLFALLSKKDSITFYAIIPFTIWFFTNISLKRILVILGANALPFLIFWFASKSIENKVVRKLLQWENPLFIDSTILDRIPQGIYSTFFYLKMFILPHPLVAYYGYNQVPIVGWTHPVVLFTILGIGVFIYLLFKNFKNRNIALYGFIYFFIGISMFTNIVKPVVGIVGERFAFIPSVGLCIAAVWLLFTYLKVPYENLQSKVFKLSNGIIVFLVLIIVLYGGKTFSRNKAWKNSYTLYETDVETATESAHTHSLFAAASVNELKVNKKLTMKEKKVHVDNAIKYYKESLRILPDYVTSLNNLGMVYYTYYNKPLDAMPYLEKAIKLDTSYTEAYFNLATCLAAVKEYEKAEKLYLKVIAMYDQSFVLQKSTEIVLVQLKKEIETASKGEMAKLKRAYRIVDRLSREKMKYDEKSIEYINSYYSLSNMYAINKQFDKIIQLNSGAIEKDLKSDVPYINIGNVYFMKGDTLKALPYLEKAITLNWNNRFLNTFLSDYYKRGGDDKKSTYYYNLMTKSSK